jgi:TetR/AcrR family transcriptional regulator, cholesterol catabolism regulator
LNSSQELQCHGRSVDHHPGGRAAAARGGRPRVEGAKREEILRAAALRFGRDGYEDTKWADIAGDVGVGPTALYHYFESKQHCLYVIMDLAIETFSSRFAALTADPEADPVTALVAVIEDSFDMGEHDVQRNRVLVAEQGLLSGRSASPREEEARQAARARTRDLEFAWATFLARAMERGAIPENDPRLLARAVLCLYNSVWHWYRPDGIMALPRVAEFFKDRSLALLGVTPEVERVAA